MTLVEKLKIIPRGELFIRIAQGKETIGYLYVNTYMTEFIMKIGPHDQFDGEIT